MKIKQIKKILQKYDRYDLTVNSTKNFYANNILIHNSSVRLSNQKIIFYPKWLTKLLVTLYNKGYGNYKIVKMAESLFRKEKWTPIAGSRRVIKLKDNEQSSYYDEDIYNLALNQIAQLIPKSWVIYGELIGWAGEKPIQKNYTYNVPKNQVHLYVYRIAIVNEDGVSYDLSFHQMERWCKENGLNICPKMWEGKKEDFDYEKYMDIDFVKSGYTQCVPLSKDSPCDEGVVIRVEGPLTPELFKAKSPTFLGHETKLLDSGEISIEEEQSETVEE